MNVDSVASSPPSGGAPPTLQSQDGSSSDPNLFFKIYHPNRSSSTAGGKNLLQAIHDHDSFAEFRKENPHYPFADKAEWEVVKWMTDASLTQQQIDAFLKLAYVQKLPTSYQCR